MACHALSHKRGGHTTAAEHMPASHRAHLEWTPAKLIDWGRRIGVSTAAVVTWQLEHRPHPEQGYRACLGLQRLAREYTPARLEAACARALAIRSPTFRSVDSILKSGLDRQHRLLPADDHHAAGARERARPRLLPLTPHCEGDRPMLNEHTLTQLRSLRLDGMVRAIEEQATSTAADGARASTSG